jgi:transcriptional regulator with XRE-family HTH domain
MQARNRNVEEMLKVFGRNIMLWRKLRGVSAVDLADRAGIHRGTLKAIESGAGSPRLENVFAVMNALGIAGEVVGGASPESTEEGLALLYARANRSSRSNGR